ncbi:MAG: LysR substrate-binding domain-containing protein, partial [Pseudomonadota bacterium]
SAPDPDLVGRQVATQKSGVYASTDYLTRLAADPQQRLDWLRFLHWEAPQKAIIDVYPNTRVAMQMDDMVAMYGAVRAGLGATRMPCFIGDTDPDLGRVPGIGLFPYPPIWVLTHADLRAVPRIAAFTRFVSDALREHRASFAGE